MPANLNQRNQRVNVDHFSMVPRADIPRSTFTTEHTHKTTFDGGLLIPILVDEVLPGDHISGQMTVFARMNTLLFPLMDHITLETFFFFVPNRLLWQNWKRMMGEKDNVADSISYTVPQCQIYINSDIKTCDIFDYMGIPGHGQIPSGNGIAVNALPFRAYRLIYHEWFRDQNLQDSYKPKIDDGPDVGTDNYALYRRNKRHDYFTSALPWPLKGGTGVNMPLSGQAPVTGLGFTAAAGNVTAGPISVHETGGTLPSYPYYVDKATATINLVAKSVTLLPNPGIYADLSQASGATINALRLAVQTQRLLERDARSGTRYTELLRAHFGVLPEDARLQRPEYIGGGRSPVQTQAIPQTSQTNADGTGTPLAALGAQSTITGQHNFKYSATEHGVIIGLAHVDAELTYQQGLHRLWTRQTRYDYYWPVFAHLGEQPIRNDELYVQGTVGVAAASPQDTQTFGYQERWAEYRHRPSRISGYFRSTAATSIDAWHSAQLFTALPTLNATFMASAPPFARNLAAGSLSNGLQFLADMLFRIKNTRAMPMYSVPGSMDRF